MVFSFLAVAQLASQIAYHPTQVHFRVSRLEAAFHRGLHPFLVLRSAHTLDEEIGAPTLTNTWPGAACGSGPS